MKVSVKQANFAVGKTIRYFRKKEGYTQQALADHLDMSRTSINNIEAERQGVSIELLYIISSFLGVSVHDLIPINMKPVIRLKRVPPKRERYIS